jgi:hypothetical protein
MKRYGNDIIIFALLQISYRSLGVPNQYARLTSRTMWGMVYKGWGVEKKFNSNYELWDNKGNSQIEYV